MRRLLYLMLARFDVQASVQWSWHPVSPCHLQVKYKGGKRELSSSLYSLLPETEQMKFAKAATELQSEVSHHSSGQWGLHCSAVDCHGFKMCSDGSKKKNKLKWKYRSLLPLFLFYCKFTFSSWCVCVHVRTNTSRKADRRSAPVFSTRCQRPKRQSLRSRSLSFRARWVVHVCGRKEKRDCWRTVTFVKNKYP